MIKRLWVHIPVGPNLGCVGKLEPKNPYKTALEIKCKQTHLDTGKHYLKSLSALPFEGFHAMLWILLHL